MIPTSNYESRNGARVRLVVLHSTEGALDVDSLGAYFQTGTNQASYHGAMDNNRFETYVPYQYASWSILSGNHISDNAAFCGFAAWSRSEWLARPHMLDLGAAWLAERCVARGLPIRRLSVQDTLAAVRDPNHPGGVIMHRDYTLATGDGTHTDCGDNLPWDVIIPRAQQLAGVVPMVATSMETTMALNADRVYNSGTSPMEWDTTLTVEPVGTSLVMPQGSRAWIRWGGSCTRDTSKKAHVWWLVERHADGTARSINPFDVPHGGGGTFELSRGTVQVEVGLENVPPGFAFAVQIDGIGHA